MVAERRHLSDLPRSFKDSDPERARIYSNPDENSVYTYYKNLIRLRKEYKVFTDEEYIPVVEEDERLFAYRRRTGEGELLVVCNFFKDEILVDLLALGWTGEERLLICNYRDGGQPAEKERFRAYEARMYYKIC